MKFKTIFIFLLLLTLAELGQACHSSTSGLEQNEGTVEALDRKNGFKNAKFGMPIDAFKSLIPEKDNKPGYSHQSYTIPTANVRLGSIPISVVRYTFYKGRLIQIELQVEEIYSYKLVQALQIAYGPGKETILGPVWEGRNVLMNIVKLEDKVSNKTYLSVHISSQEMYRQNQIEARRKRRIENERNANDL